MDSIIVKIKGGLVTAVEYPEGYEGPFVVIHIYDVEGGAEGHLPVRDDDDNKFLLHQW